MAPRPLMQVVAAQQNLIAELVRQVDFLGRMAGVETQLAALRHTADVNNPADPVPDPAAQGAPETTDQARTPGAYDDPRVPGMTPGSVSGVPAAATDVPMTPGASIPTSPFGQLQDVTAPIAGTQTGDIPAQAQNGITEIPVDVRVGDPMNPATGFPWTISPNQSNGQAPPDGEMAGGGAGRAMASLRLAEARLAAGIAIGDKFAVAAGIEGDQAMTAGRIGDELATLARIAGTAGNGAPRRSDLVPRRAAAAPMRPAVPSFAEPPRMAHLGSQMRADEIELSDMLL